MWRHSRWYESDWMIHTAIESAQENSHISAWECSHTAVKQTVVTEGDADGMKPIQALKKHS